MVLVVVVQFYNFSSGGTANISTAKMVSMVLENGPSSVFFTLIHYFLSVFADGGKEFENAPAY